MKTILVVDDLPIIRDPIAAMLGSAGYRALGAASGADALKLLHNNRADLILLDVMMPQMDGLTFLRQVRADPSTARIPVIMLSSEEDRQHIVQAAQLGIQGCVLKSRLSLKDLLRRVQSHLEINLLAAPKKISTDVRLPDPLLTRQACIVRAQHDLQGKTVSGVVAQVISVAQSDQGNMRELAELVARDGTLTARILQLANSAAYKTTHPATNISDAVRQIGCSGVRNIATSVGLYDAMPASAADGFNPLLCWRHSLAVATLCERLAAAGHAEGLRGHAYLTGLCHDLGEIYFRLQFAAEYQVVLETQVRTGRPRWEIERALLGITHGELVVTILKTLGLPDAIRQPIEAFHEGGHSLSADAARLVSLLRLAESGANGALFAAADDANLQPITAADFRAATGTDRPPAFDWAAFRNEIQITTSALAQLSVDDEIKLMAPLYPANSSRVWVARDSGLSSFDPVTAGLQSMSDCVTVHDRLPDAAELRDCDAVVILARDASVPHLTANDVDKLLTTRPDAPPHLLWLIGHSTPSRPAAGSVLWPFPLSRLANFIRSCGK